VCGYVLGLELAACMRGPRRDGGAAVDCGQRVERVKKEKIEAGWCQVQELFRTYLIM
jgi:hypothetical protein